MHLLDNVGLWVATLGVVMVISSLVWLWQRPPLSSAPKALNSIQVSDEDYLLSRIRQAEIRERELRTSGRIYQVFAYAIVGAQAGIGFVIALPNARMMTGSGYLLNLLGACVVILAVGQAIRPGQRAELLRSQATNLANALCDAQHLLAGATLDRRRIRRASRHITDTLKTVEEIGRASCRERV